MEDASQPQPRHLRERRRLRERFEGIYHGSLVDKDFVHLTSDRRAHREARTYFLGEIFFVEKAALPSPVLHALPGTDTAGVRLGLVTRRQASSNSPVEVAPAMRWHATMQDSAGCFLPQELPEKLQFGTAFDLLYRRPVPRRSFHVHLATLTALDKQMLAGQVEASKHLPHFDT